MPRSGGVCSVAMPGSSRELLLSLEQSSRRRLQELCESGDQGFWEEYQALRSSDVPQSADEANSKENRSKNRYRDVLPFNLNRVVLKDGGYINASLIQVGGGREARSAWRCGQDLRRTRGVGEGRESTQRRRCKGRGGLQGPINGSCGSLALGLAFRA